MTASYKYMYLLLVYLESGYSHEWVSETYTGALISGSLSSCINLVLVRSSSTSIKWLVRDGLASLAVGFLEKRKNYIFIAFSTPEVNFFFHFKVKSLILIHPWILKWNSLNFLHFESFKIMNSSSLSYEYLSQLLSWINFTEHYIHTIVRIKHFIKVCA